MQIIPGIDALRRRLPRAKRIAFVPTMGNLHDGHLALVKQARQNADCVVVSIFVNPLQFGPNEDYAHYPRSFAEDCVKLKALGTEFVFNPEAAEILGAEQRVFVELPAIANELEGAFRPGFFRGVATIVLKLFNIVQPATAVFGNKDYQQLHIVRLVTQQLNLPVKIVAVDTVRADDGVALSSRNGYLSADQRARAPRLYENLQRVGENIRNGDRGFEALESSARAELESGGWRVDYVSIRNADTLQSALPGDTRFVVLGAARLGETRLIDNLEICVGG
ncbi:MAG: pantoate--beta-alanine ligase [Burkholderiales bacterium]